MKAFTIDAENNITVHASKTAAFESAAAPEATAAGTEVFTSAERLAELAPGGKRLVAIWNGLTGVTPVKKFMSAAAGARRIFAELEKLEVPTAAPVPEALATKAPHEKKARAAAAAAGVTQLSGPRPGSKNAQVIELARRHQGVTLAELEAFGWQKHTARSLMSAGGSLTKKYGITVISEKLPDGTRNYRIEA